MELQQLLGTEHPLIQAPMAGVQGHPLAVAVCNAGALGSLPCAMLAPDAIRAELETMRGKTDRPFNLNFFCHEPPTPDAAAEAAWREALAPYYREFGVDPAQIAAGAARMPFDEAAAALVEAFRPPVVSFHFRQQCGAYLHPIYRKRIPHPHETHSALIQEQRCTGT